MNEQSITTEIRKFIADKISNNEAIVIPWLITEILDRKNDIGGNDLPFYLTCTRKAVSEIVRKCVGKYDTTPANDAQIVLPGFDHLQVAYPVERNGQQILVPVNQLSDDELEQRAKEYDTMARSCRLHAREIRDYLKARREAA